MKTNTQKHFYSHLVATETIEMEIESMDIEDHEKKHLLDLAHSQIHHTIIDRVLSELPNEEKKIFLYLLASGDHESIWDHLKGKTKGIESKIRKTADVINKELIKDIKKVK